METCHGIICLSAKNFRGKNEKNGKTRLVSSAGREKKAHRVCSTTLWVVSAFVLLLLLCVSQTNLMSEGCQRSTRRLCRILGGFYTMQRMVNSNVGYQEMENEPWWDECSYISSEWDQLDQQFDQMWMREEWLRRGKYRPRNSYDRCPYGCTDADLVKDLSEENINERLAKLGSQVGVKEMFILWSNVHRHERKKYIKMQERAKMFCDNLVKTFHIPEEVRIRVWMRVHRCMTSVFLRFEKRHHKHFLMFLRRGPSSRARFLRYINRTRNVWNMRRMKINKYWRNKMAGVFRLYWSRYHNAAYPVRGVPRRGVKEYTRVGSEECDRVGSGKYDMVGYGEYGSRGIREQDSRNVGLNDRSCSSLYGSRDSSLYESGDNRLYGSRDSSLYGSRDSSLYESGDNRLYGRRDSSLYGSRDSSLYGSRDSSLYGSRDSSLYGSKDSSLYSSRDSSLYSSRDSSLYSSRDSSLYGSRDSSLYGSRDSSLYGSRDSSLYESGDNRLYGRRDSSLYGSRDSSLYGSRDSSLYGSRDSSLYGSRDSVLYESRDKGVDKRRNECLGESRNDNLYDSIDQGLNVSRSEGLYDKRINGAMKESRCEGNT
ncbi:Plasmodium exported protein, unknown function [Plasmodium knowlesi strain H]|uniref:Plasmodium RESA N-terminal domain-containing protein n=3 Tax=Plasmodium knowlesi TaxID=5850 RepID=A0A5K1VN51_PLAKH|nr:Plasmodium exported protein (PHIST), unknown function [Plasmodium knowlesi strain H]OTN68357.1 Uncharacterized protein PKNOH_S03315200 [Plasmodium knowlesi]CAA9987055.1 Plasmodium exported protein (PHIST), unknown function [Plasmodium knowlesi strain H]SBO23772.1 Plasmodium exported protein, unknown function [Plasmodium knowlesi strain H]SBO25491.1 Plasmodium exported protein, unknown function [Plasmodium knowlesi strain H]VVS76529.1 Plasmodium exported protein (PHIST), unknown function [Pl|eukprot:XP_002261678.1 hypothetical protein, conserved in Plasmodium species [Plasmodium knowlesi strain H]